MLGLMSPRKGKGSQLPPLGVVMMDAAEPKDCGDSVVDAAEQADGERVSAAPELKPTALLDAVNDVARAFGVRDGQSIAEARALVAHLVVRRVSERQVLDALGRIAEIALAFGPTVAISAPDTVWVDVTGTAHLLGGEPALAIELSGRVRALGHVVRVAIASGPELSRAFGRWAPRAAQGEGTLVVPTTDSGRAFARLPISALPLERDAVEWLVRLGVLTVGDLAALPRAAAAARLGPNASRVLDLCEGHDSAPLRAYEPERVLVEQVGWEDAVVGLEPLLFALRGLVARMSARLAGRGEAAQALVVTLEHDRSVARLERVEPQHVLSFELAAPLWREDEMRRVILSRLERTKLEAPCIGVRLEVPSITPALGRQLDFSRVMSGVAATCRGAESLPVVVAELVADVGKNRVGVLKLTDSHRPEQKSMLGPALERRRKTKSTIGARRNVRKASPRRSHEARSSDPRFPNAPTRLLPKPLLLAAALRPGVTLCIERRLYTIESVAFAWRLDAVEWWTRAPVERDYLRLVLRSTEGVVEALVYVDRNTGDRFLHAIGD